MYEFFVNFYGTTGLEPETEGTAHKSARRKTEDPEPKLRTQNLELRWMDGQHRRKLRRSQL